MNNATLLIIGHGSRSSQWNQNMAQLVNDMRELPTPADSFRHIDCCFLEHAEPSIPQAVSHWTDEPNQHVVALPLFLSISEHVLNDIPQEVAKVAQTVEREGCTGLYRRNGCNIHLLQPAEAPRLIAENCARRFRRLSLPPDDTGVVFVYYGSSQFMKAWNRLAGETKQHFQSCLPAIAGMDHVFAGHVAGFSPQPLVEKIEKMARLCRYVVVMPALVSVGVIQDEVIPAALEQCTVQKQVVYRHDAILPDPELAQNVLRYAQEKSQPRLQPAGL